MDDADRANAEVERSLQEALRSRRPEGPLPQGACLLCDEPVDGQRRWCDADCRNQWEKRRARS
jgi:hypothetical protein